MAPLASQILEPHGVKHASLSSTHSARSQDYMATDGWHFFDLARWARL